MATSCRLLFVIVKHDYREGRHRTSLRQRVPVLALRGAALLGSVADLSRDLSHGRENAGSL